jgi:hypothetical protein
LNGYKKKNFLLMTIEALLLNPKVNLEFHLHLVISILLKAVISAKISLNHNDFEYHFREKAAHLLGTFVNKYLNKLRLQVLQPQVQRVRCVQQTPPLLLREKRPERLPNR